MNYYSNKASEISILQVHMHKADIKGTSHKLSDFHVAIYNFLDWKSKNLDFG